MSAYGSNRARHRLLSVFILDWMLARIDALRSVCPVPSPFPASFLSTLYTGVTSTYTSRGSIGFRLLAAEREQRRAAPSGAERAPR